MSSSAGHRNASAKYHVLDAFVDDEQSCAVTILEKGVRFHVIADTKDFKKSAKICTEYKQLVQSVQEQEQREEEKLENAQLNGKSGKTSNAVPPATETASSDSLFVPDDDSGVDVTSPPPRKGGFEMDVTDTMQELQNWLLAPLLQSSRFREAIETSDVKKELSVWDWYHGPAHFFSIKPKQEGDALELEELKASDKDLQARMNNLMPLVEVPKYIHQLKVTHYEAHDLMVLDEAAQPEPFHPTLVRTSSEGGDGKSKELFLKLVDRDQPGPAKREIKLLKKIEELGLHHKFNVPQLEGLVYASDPSSKSSSKQSKQILGFLLTPVPSATPLIKLLDESVPEKKREKWAKEVSRITELLHSNDIIFGDMKADNFLVDEHNKLWIIDFGGSYTEGWVDPELAETEEGDDMGVERIVGALRDPIGGAEGAGEKDAAGGNVDTEARRKELDAEVDRVDDDNEESDKDSSAAKEKSESDSQNKKRKREDRQELDEQDMKKTKVLPNSRDGDNDNDGFVGSEDQGMEEGPKAGDAASEPEQVEGKDDLDSKEQDESEKQEKQYCTCGQPESGRMIACDNKGCKIEWFHFDCVGLKESPPKGEEWFCEDCRIMN